MLDVKTKIEKALEALKKEKRKINPSAVEKRAGVANGSLKNHPVLREIVLIEKNKYRQSKSDTAQVVKNRRNTVEKKRYEELEARNNRLKLENSQFQAEMKTMADSIAQLNCIVIKQPHTRIHRMCVQSKSNASERLTEYQQNLLKRINHVAVSLMPEFEDKNQAVEALMLDDGSLLQLLCSIQMKQKTRTSDYEAQEARHRREK